MATLHATTNRGKVSAVGHMEGKPTHRKKSSDGTAGPLVTISLCTLVFVNLLAQYKGDGHTVNICEAEINS